MTTLNDLPTEIIIQIVEHFDLGNRQWGHIDSLNVLHFSRVDKRLNEILWLDVSFYERLWKRYISETLPKSTDLRRDFYGAMRNIEDMTVFDVYNEKVFYFAQKGYSYAFEEHFALNDYTQIEFLKLFSIASGGSYLRIMKCIYDVSANVFPALRWDDLFVNAIISARQNERSDTLQWLREICTKLPFHHMIL